MDSSDKDHGEHYDYAESDQTSAHHGRHERSVHGHSHSDHSNSHGYNEANYVGFTNESLKLCPSDPNYRYKVDSTLQTYWCLPPVTRNGTLVQGEYNEGEYL